ncbi:GTPase-activating protein BEM3 Ecym_7102 [Eremothecium cymbalariae DBVPG|uniref:Rho-GAP domain-containing protein n=1 Tax=Eremothecium cymbalariae (strain CBS 270.75 / DBVPG 7215 / KCTC 17166 / NRRL Y-17582) TaxID=931890 RepID=G8JVT9_ERECY|nr:hypothetical protein Ecym_7102 [Eremothecium cymbalariae DBVPG\
MDNDSDADNRSYSGSSTLQLLAQYDKYTMERDRSIESIEKNRFSESSRPSYDDLFKENVKLKLQLKETHLEIESLKSIIAHFQDSGRFEATKLEQRERSEPSALIRDLALPPRSADRKRNTKNLTLGTSSPLFADHFSSALSGVALKELSNSSRLSASSSVLAPRSADILVSRSSPIEEKQLLSPMKAVSRSSSTYSTVLGSPATSVLYKTSRISINSPAKSSATSKAASTLSLPDNINFENEGNQLSPQKTDRVTQLIKSELQVLQRERVDKRSASRSNSPGISVDKTGSRSRKPSDLSTGTRADLGNFKDMVDNVFNENDQAVESSVNSSEDSINKSMDHLNTPNISIKDGENVETPLTLNRGAASDVYTQTPFVLTTSTGEKLESPAASANTGHMASLSSTGKLPQAATPSADPHLMSASVEGSTPHSNQEVRSADVPLFVQPEDLGTIKMEVISTLYHEPGNSANILFSVIDRKSSKEMFKFAKTIDSVIEFDMYIRSNMDSLALPPLPDKQLFATNIPVKVDTRRENLNDYFSSLLYMTNLLPGPALKLAEFISTTPVMNPVMGDYSKEGILLVRKAKTLGSAASWRVRYCTVEGNVMYLNEQSFVTDTIKLAYSTIELQANLPDDRYGTKNGFIINEHKKSGLSSSTKYYFCAETSREREQWISVLTIMCDAPGGGNLNVSFNNRSEASSLVDQGSASDSSYLGPIANLEVNNDINSPPKIPDGTGNICIPEDEKEVKRRRMKSFFAFKKLSNPAPYSSGNDNVSIFSQDEEVNSTTTGTESTIHKSLQSMHLYSNNKVVFGADLKTALQLSSHAYQGRYEIPSIVFRTLEFLYKNRGIHEEGIFRLSGSSLLIKSLQEQFDRDHDVDLCNYNKNVVVSPENENQGGIYVDVNTVTGLLKLYLRRLPHMIFGDDAFSAFKQIVDKPGGKDTKFVAQEFKTLLFSGKIPKENISLMYALFELLVKINDNNNINKMNLRNLCIVFSPTLNIPVNILQPFILDFGYIFQDKALVNNGQNVNLHIPL